MGSSKKPKCKIKALDKENSIEATKEALRDLLLDFPDAQWTVNITGGTKPMSIGAYEFFKERNAKILYVPIIGQSRAIDFSDGPALNLEYKLKVKEFLAGYGFDYFKKDEAITEGENRAKDLFILAVNLSANIDHTHKIMKDIDKRIEEVWPDDPGKARSKARDKGISQIKLEVQNQKIKGLLSESFCLKIDGDNLNGALDRHSVQFLTSGWLEVFIWGILSKYSNDLGIFDVRLGILPRKKLDKKALNKEVKNDWGIAFMYDQSLRCQWQSKIPQLWQ